MVKEKGWSLREFFRRVDLAQTTMTAWEKGIASPEKHLFKIASVLDTSEEYLRGETDDPSPKEKPSTDYAAWEDALRAIGALNPDGTVNRERVEAFIEFEKSAQKLGSTKKK